MREPEGRASARQESDLRGWWGNHFFEEDGANIELHPGVYLELAREENGGWSVWGIRIDGKLYREPRDLTGEPLHEGPFRARVEEWDRAKTTVQR